MFVRFNLTERKVVLNISSESSWDSTSCTVIHEERNKTTFSCNFANYNIGNEQLNFIDVTLVDKQFSFKNVTLLIRSGNSLFNFCSTSIRIIFNVWRWLLRFPRRPRQRRSENDKRHRIWIQLLRRNSVQRSKQKQLRSKDRPMEPSAHLSFQHSTCVHFRTRRCDDRPNPRSSHNSSNQKVNIFQ